MKKNLYFLGIGGIGMSALVKYFHSLDKKIAGYDRVETSITKNLEKLGVQCNYNEDIKNIPLEFNRDNTLVIYTPAIPKNHKQYLYFLENGFEIKKRAEVLGTITKDTFCLAISGTHGKTTTSSILAHIFHEIGKSATSFLGGILEGYNSNYIEGKTDTTIVEADEFDRSFLHLNPDIACVTSTDADHLDIYSNHENLKKTFLEFANRISKKENLITKKELNLNIPNSKTYSVNDNTADFFSENIKYKNGKYIFDFVVQDNKSKKIENIELNLLGDHNVENATAAMSMAFIYGLDLEKVKRAISSFKGIKRRCSVHINTENLIYIDDYAHHPQEIKSIISGTKKSFPNKKVTTVFQPHLFSRTKDFMTEFAKELEISDDIILLDIYPARELPIEGVTSKALLNKINSKNKILLQKSEVIPFLKRQKLEVLLTLGAGDIGEMVEDIETSLLT